MFLIRSSPPLSWYSRRPVINLPATAIRERDAESMESENELDAHVEELLSKRAKIRRSLQGLWAYIKTPIGFIAGKCSSSYYTICVDSIGTSNLWLPYRVLGCRHRPLPRQMDQLARLLPSRLLGRNLFPSRKRSLYRPRCRFPSLENYGHLEHVLDLLLCEVGLQDTETH
jgi:hypothetical protein